MRTVRSAVDDLQRGGSRARCAGGECHVDTADRTTGPASGTIVRLCEIPSICPNEDDAIYCSQQIASILKGDGH